MKKLGVLLILLTAALAAGGVVVHSYGQAKKTGATKTSDEAAIMKCYMPGKDLFVFDVTPPRQHVGWEDYKKDWGDLYAAFPGPLHDEIRDLNITAEGNLAYSHHIESGYFTRKNGSRLDIAVRVTDAYRKVNGNWVIVQEHVSVPVDIDTGKSDLLSKP